VQALPSQFSSMKILNLGCGHKVSSHPHVVNIDWSMYVRVRGSPILNALGMTLLDSTRKERLRRIPRNIMAHDLSKGIPFGDGTVDVVFHNNVLEHLDRDVAEEFLVECRRVLKPGGIHRIVVPDFELAARQYLDHVARCDLDANELDAHDNFIAVMLEQSVRREAAGTQQQPKMRRWLENRLLGDARHRGETHQWAYDRHTLTAKLQRTGYSEVRVHDFLTSGITDWAQYGLETAPDGSEYAPGSLYLEARA
jgi:SAM-dependent methyltransferase